MDEFCTAWFRGFTQGLAALPASARETLLSHCASAGAETGARQRYEALFASAGRDRDAFFAHLSEIPGVRGTVLVRGRVYEVIFSHCVCDLHTRFDVDDPALCECSLRSILHVPIRKIRRRECVWNAWKRFWTETRNAVSA